MRHAFAATAIATLMLVSCTSPPDDHALPSSSEATQAPTVTTPPPSPSDIQFLLREGYPMGRRIHVQIENVGEVAYRYQTLYAACYLRYRDDAGRVFIIPPGTHCDILSVGAIEPGETKTLFRWDLDECTKDNWGCARARPLPPGTYRISGRFKPVGGGIPARAKATFTITAA